MARLPDLRDDEIPAELTDTVKAQQKAYGTVLNSTRQVAYVPHVALGAGAMSRGLSRSGKTPKRLSHLLNLRVGAIVGCPL